MGCQQQAILVEGSKWIALGNGLLSMNIQEGSDNATALERL